MRSMIYTFSVTIMSHGTRKRTICANNTAHDTPTHQLRPRLVLHVDGAQPQRGRPHAPVVVELQLEEGRHAEHDAAGAVYTVGRVCRT